MNDLTAPNSAVFDFIAFARKIYSENPEIYISPRTIEKGERFLLPALYGGDTLSQGSSGAFEALVVLEAPAVPFTSREWRKRWTKPCTTAEEAVNRHREIFFRWAFHGSQARLFRGLVGEACTSGDFFARLYITDIWKDAAFENNRKQSNPQYERYWRLHLETEIKSVASTRVIFVGKQASVHGWDYVPSGIPRHEIPFPSDRNKHFRIELQRFLAEIRGERATEDSSGTSRDQGLKNGEFGAAPAAADHNWTLNDEINHNKFGVIPSNQHRIQMNLSYQNSRTEKSFPVARLLLDMADLLGNGLVREVDRGFLLRFVQDPADKNIYIQVNLSSPRRFVAKVPALASKSV